jgi:hypothetical protein
MRSQTRHELSQGLVEILLDRSKDTESISIYSRGQSGGDLTEDERIRYRHMAVAEMRYHEDVHYQYRNGLYDEAEFLAQREQWKNNYANKGRKDAFCRVRNGFSPEYVKEVEELLGNFTCE